MIVNIPAVAGIYPVVPVGSPLKDAATTSVVAVPVAAVVTTEAQVAEVIAPVPRADVPDATIPELGAPNPKSTVTVELPAAVASARPMTWDDAGRVAPASWQAPAVVAELTT